MHIETRVINCGFNEIHLFDPRLIVAMTVFPSSPNVEVVMLNTLLPLGKKITISLPPRKQHRPAGISIKSIQKFNLDKEFFLVEIADGLMTPQVQEAIKVLTFVMKRMVIQDVFFPASFNSEQTIFFKGAPGNFKPLSPSYENIRIIENDAILFVYRTMETTEIKKLLISDINLDWIENSLLVAKSKKRIIFISRGQARKDHKIILVFANGEVGLLDMDTGNISSIDIDNRVSAYIGDTFGIDTAISKTGEELIIF